MNDCSLTHKTFIGDFIRAFGIIVRDFGKRTSVLLCSFGAAVKFKSKQERLTNQNPQPATAEQ